MPNADRFPGALILEDGRIFGGEPFGAPVDVEGEAVFTTTMTGYQEVATDPSFRGQIVCMTYPLIGNYGVMADDDQSRQPWIAGMIVREYCDEPSNWRSTGTFADYLARHGIPALRGVDTRALTRHLRLHGTMRALMVHDRQRWTAAELRERARSAWSPGDVDVVKDVTTIVQRNLQMDAPLHVVVIDCGVKERILQSLQQRGVRVSVVPYDSAPEEILALNPDGVLTSPGPGDPAHIEPAVHTIRTLIDARMPYLGVCLGHQLLALAIGARTSKLKFGHRGGNHPVKDLMTGLVYITSQNHGYQVDAGSVPLDRGWRVAYVSLNDGSVEGLTHISLPVFSIQYHPEGAPGPQDSQYLFDRFIRTIQRRRAAHSDDETHALMPAVVAGEQGQE